MKTKNLFWSRALYWNLASFTRHLTEEIGYAASSYVAHLICTNWIRITFRDWWNCFIDNCNRRLQSQQAIKLRSWIYDCERVIKPDKAKVHFVGLLKVFWMFWNNIFPIFFWCCESWKNIGKNLYEIVHSKSPRIILWPLHQTAIS